jgi:WD40 repeat protein
MRATIKLIAICLMLFFNINRLCAQIPELMLPIGHTGWIDNAHFSPDGKLVLTASYRDCSVRIWDAVTGDLLKTIKHSDLIRDAIFSSDGKTINGLLKQKSDSCIIWDVKTGDSLSCVSKDESQFNSNNKSSQNVKYVLTDTSTCIYDATTGMLLFDLKEGNYFSKLSPNHKAILTADRAGNVKVRDLSTGSIIGNLEGYLSNIVFSQFTSDGKLVVIATEDSTVYLWNLTTGRQLLKLKSNISNLPFFSTDEKKLFTISLDGYSINIWNLTTGEKIKNLIGHTGEINSCEINKEGTLLLTSSVDKTARIWDIRSGKSVVIFRGYSMGIGGVSDPSLDNKNRYLASACEDSSAIVWSLASGKLVQKFKGHHGPLTAAVISSNGDWLVTASVDSTACIWDIKTGKLLKKFIGHGGSIDKVELSFDCTKLITTSQYDFTFRVWDVNSEHEIFNCYVPSEQQPITVMINDSTFEEWIQTGYSLETFLSFDNKHLIAYSDAKILYVYNLNTKKEVARLNGVKCFPSISRNNKLAIMYEDLIPDVVDTTCGSNSNGQKVFIYDLNKDMRLLQVNSVGGKDDFYNLIFSQDDKYFAIKKNDDSILVFNNSENIINRYYNFGYWELEDGTILTFDSSWIYCDAGPLVEFKLNNFSYSPIFLFSNDNNKLTYADHDKLCIIDADNGNILHTLWHDGLVFPLITSDNSMVFTFGGDHKTKCWDLSSGKLLYTRIQLQGSDWLVYDDNYRFDGSIGAIELLKFRCGSEVTDLAQLKDSLWVPDLANKIMNNQEIIINNKPAPKLSDLNICELTPVIEPLEQENKNILKYRITPRNGGLGETEVYINGNLTYSLKPEQLAKKKENKKVVYYLNGKHNDIRLENLVWSNSISILC